MTLRKMLFFLLLVVAAGILVWLFRDSPRTPRNSRKAAWSEIIADLNACGRRKHIKAAQHDHFARIAAAEKRPEAERLFRALAFSERLQEQNCAAAIRRLGGEYRPPRPGTLFGGSTDGNLDRCIQAERRSYHEHRDAEIRRAMTRGNRYAARTLVWASAADLKSIFLLECRHGSRECAFAVCPVCGNLYATEYLDRYCPFCLTDGEKFVRFE